MRSATNETTIAHATRPSAVMAPAPRPISTMAPPHMPRSMKGTYPRLRTSVMVLNLAARTAPSLNATAAARVRPWGTSGRDTTVRPATLALRFDAGQCGQGPGRGLYPTHEPAARASHAAVDPPESDAAARVRHGPRHRAPPRPAAPRAVAFLEGAADLRARQHHLLARHLRPVALGVPRPRRAEPAEQAPAPDRRVGDRARRRLGRGRRHVHLALRPHRALRRPNRTRHHPHDHAGDAAARRPPLHAASDRPRRADHAHRLPPGLAPGARVADTRARAHRAGGHRAARRASGTDQPALPLQQPELDRPAHPGRSREGGGMRRAPGGDLPLHPPPRRAGVRAARRGAADDARLPRHRARALRRASASRDPCRSAEPALDDPEPHPAAAGRERAEARPVAQARRRHRLDRRDDGWRAADAHRGRRRPRHARTRARRGVRPRRRAAQPARAARAALRSGAPARDRERAGPGHRRAAAPPGPGSGLMNTSLRTLVVDDEKLARDRLSGFLAGLGGVELIGEAANGVEAVQMIQERHPDLVFLDVQMPGMDGFEVLRALPGPRPQVVFATAYDEYAIRAFEVQAVDYLLKPVARARVEEALGRARTRLSQGGPALDLEAVVRRIEQGRKAYVTQISVHSGRRILLLPVEDVRWFGVEHRLVYAHTGERAFMTNYTLRELEERLDPELFFRVHKASLVNLRHVKEIVPWFGGRYKLAMRDHASSEVAVSRTQARALRAKLRW